MHLLLNKHPFWFIFSQIFSFYLVLYLATSLLISWWSGWSALASQFRLREPFTGSKWRGQGGQMRWLCSYKGCLTVGADSQGLYLATPPFFPLFHPPLFIPWNEISAARKNIFFVAGVRFELGRELPIPLWVRERLAEQLRGVAGSAYPAQTEVFPGEARNA